MDIVSWVSAFQFHTNDLSVTGRPDSNHVLAYYLFSRLPIRKLDNTVVYVSGFGATFISFF